MVQESESGKTPFPETNWRSVITIDFIRRTESNQPSPNLPHITSKIKQQSLIKVKNKISLFSQNVFSNFFRVYSNFKGYLCYQTVTSQNVSS